MRHFLHSFAVVALFAVTLFSFQNCSSPIAEDEEIASIAAGAPFAYDFEPDTIAHMSCGYMSNYDREAFFSYKIGAYDNGSGLKFRDEFLQHTGGVSPQKRQQVLAASSQNAGGKLQISVRPLTNVNETAEGAQGGFVEGFNFGSFAGVLSSPEIALEFPQQLNAGRTNDFSSVGAVEMKNDFLQSSLNHEGRSSLISGNSVLAATFTNGSNPYYAFGPSENRAYGTGFRLNFARAANITGGSNSQTILSVADEYNLENGQYLGRWNCNPSWRFIIVRDGDQGGGYPCSAVPTQANDPTPANNAQASALAALRQVVPASQWAVDLNNMCIVQRSNVAGDCYGGNNTIRYTANTVCDSSLSTCPHYLSICKR